MKKLLIAVIAVLLLSGGIALAEDKGSRMGSDHPTAVDESAAADENKGSGMAEDSSSAKTEKKGSGMTEEKKGSGY